MWKGKLVGKALLPAVKRNYEASLTFKKSIREFPIIIWVGPLFSSRVAIMAIAMHMKLMSCLEEQENNKSSI